ncbi:hypothetical protein KKB55_07930 [Myxococcota bacterium]|nr:hypothetical protein [Myxococcota bacterium]MBU1897685.1 hypothetical protein [Myxococcota bacterium]
MRAPHPPLLLLALLLACADEGASTASNTPDAWALDAVGVDVGAALDLSVAPRLDAGGPVGDAQPAVDAAAAPIGPFPMDDLTRVGVARFDLTPEGWEAWRDVAGPSCPKNRPDRYDGPLQRRGPSEPCEDVFDDTNGDGIFDAIYLGGDGPDRPAQGVDQDNPPEGRVLLLQRGQRIWLLVTLDIYALDAPRVEALTGRLSDALGLAPTQIALHATGITHGPDALGLSGPSLRLVAPEVYALFDKQLGLLEGLAIRDGVNAAWWDIVAARAANAARRAAARLKPGVARVATVTLMTPQDTPLRPPIDADGDGAYQDPEDLAAWRASQPLFARAPRLPDPPDGALRLLQFEDQRGGIISTLMIWGVRSQLASGALLSADTPGRARRHLEAAQPQSIALWITGAGAGIADEGALIPEVDEEGALIKGDRGAEAAAEGAEPAAPLIPAADPVEALARHLTRRALDALASAPTAALQLELRQRVVWLPLSNPRYSLAAQLGALPLLADWLSGRTITDAWASPLSASACFGLGCARHRLDAVELGPVTLLTSPGLLEDGLVQGREAICLRFDHQRAWTDLDMDGIEDEADPIIEQEARIGDLQRRARQPAPVNPQCFDAVAPLAHKRRWVLGGIGGGVGLMGSWTTHVNVFEGQLEPALALAATRPDLDLCGGAGCVDLGGLIDATLSHHAACVADIQGGHALLLAEDMGLGERRAEGWWIEGAMGQVIAEGGPLFLGPGAQAFTLKADLRGLNPVMLRLEDGDAIEILGLAPLALRDHPNAGEIWGASAPLGGDLIYNALCDLIEDCLPRPWLGDDPNAALPQGL